MNANGKQTDGEKNTFLFRPSNKEALEKMTSQPLYAPVERVASIEQSSCDSNGYLVAQSAAAVMMLTTAI